MILHVWLPGTDRSDPRDNPQALKILDVKNLQDLSIARVKRELHAATGLVPIRQWVNVYENDDNLEHYERDSTCPFVGLQLPLQLKLCVRVSGLYTPPPVLYPWPGECKRRRHHRMAMPLRKSTAKCANRHVTSQEIEAWQERCCDAIRFRDKSRNDVNECIEWVLCVAKRQPCVPREFVIDYTGNGAW